MSLTSWRARRIRALQKRNALMMLALSGVVRPSDVELRYPISPLKTGNTHTTPEALSPSNDLKASPISKASSQSPIQDTHLYRWLRPGLPASS